jgi:peptide/nickel transport system permease protein
MVFLPVLLWTDALIWVLVAASIVFGWYAMRHEHLRVPWRQVGRRPLAMGALVVLAAYVAIGLLDSVHFRERLPAAAGAESRYAPEVRSVLDVLLTGLGERRERTYSAPFAVYAHAKETVERDDGSLAREYPRLRHGGAHLTDPETRAQDVAARAGVATLVALAAWAVLVVVVVAWRRRAGESWRDAARRLRRGEDPVPWRTLLLTSGALLLVVANAAWLSRYYHVLGTDQVGQDVLLKSLKSVRTGLVIGTLTTLVMLPFALLLGIAAGYFRGWVDDVIQYLYTTLSSIPGVLLIAAAILSLQLYMALHPDSFATVAERSDARLLFLCVILGVTSWTGLCRLLRGETLKLREVEYIQAAHALGSSHGSILARHVLPNVMHLVLIAIVLDFSGLVLAEAVLSYVGVGVDPTTDSWGNMINGARLEMAREPMVWWSLTAAFVFMFTLVLAANLFSDAVRDAFDPRLRK